MTDFNASASIEVDLTAGQGSISNLSGSVEEAIFDGAKNSKLSRTVVGQLEEARGRIRSAIDSALEGVELDDISFSDRAKKSLELQASVIDAVVDADLVLDDSEIRRVERLVKDTFDNLELEPEVQPEVDQRQLGIARGQIERLSAPVVARIRADWNEASGNTVRRNLATIATAVTVPVLVTVVRGPLRAATSVIDKAFLSLARRIRDRFTTVVADSIISGGFERVTAFLGDAFRTSVDNADIPGILQSKFQLTEDVAREAGEIGADLYSQGFDRTRQELSDLAATLAQAFDGSLQGVDTNDIAGLAGLQQAFDVDTEDIQEQIRSLTNEGLTNAEAVQTIAQAYSELGRTATETINNPEELQELIDLDFDKGQAALEQFQESMEGGFGTQFRGLLRQGQAALVGFVTPLLPVLQQAGEAVVGFIQDRVAPALEDFANFLVDFFSGATFASIVDGVQETVNRIRDVFETGETSGEGGFFGVIETIALFVSTDLKDAFDSAVESIRNVIDLFSLGAEETDAANNGFSLFESTMSALGEILKFVAANLEIIILALIAYRVQQALALAITTAKTLALAAYSLVVNATAIATNVWAAAQAALNFILSANPIGLIVLAIAALVAGIVLAYRNSETFRNIVQGLWDAIQVGVSLLVELVQIGFNAISGWISDHREDINAFFKGFVDSTLLIRDVAVWIFDNVLVPAFERLKDDGETAFNAISFVIQDILIPAFEFLRDAFLTVFDFFKDRLTQAKSDFDSFKSKVETVFDAVKKAFDKVISPVQTLFNKIRDLVNLIPSVDFSGIPGLSALGNLPAFARGAILNHPTIGLVAEAGAEAIIPLTDPNRALELLRQSGLDKLILGDRGQAADGGTRPSAARTTTNSTQNVTNNIQVMTRPGQDTQNVAKALLDELALT